MNGTAEGLQPVADFLPQKPHSESDNPANAAPVTEPEKALPGFPSEPRLDAPVTTSQAIQEESVSRPISDVNVENYQQNSSLIASSGSIAEPIGAVDPAPTNGVSPAYAGEVDETSRQLGNQPSDLPKNDEISSSLPAAPPTEDLPLPGPSSLSQHLIASSDEQPISAPSLPTQISPPIEQHPISDLREVPAPIPQGSPTALRIKNDKLQEDLARDPELAEGLSAESDAPIERTLATSAVPEEPLSRPDSGLGMSDSAQAGDTMDTSLDQPPPPTSIPAENVAPLASPPHLPQEAPVPSTISVEEPAAPAPTPTLPPNDATSTADQMMTEAPAVTSEPAVPSELKHEREEDNAEEFPVSKRAKTETDSIEPEFKVPELPQTTQTPTPVNGAPMHTSAEVDDVAARMTPPRAKHLNKGIQSAKKVQCSRFFRNPVDPVAMNIPNYLEVVKEPMDLSTIEKKLKGGEYVTVTAFKADVDLMVNNAIKFNGPDHLVAKEGRELQQRMVDAISSMPPIEFEEPSRAEKKAQKVKIEPSRAVPARRQSSSNAGAARSPASTTANQTFALTPDGVPLIRRDSNVADGRPKRAIHPPKRRDDITGGRPKKKKFEWQLKFCREVLNELKKPKHYNYAQFFYYPVDPVALNIPSYHSIIKKPMDLQTVENKLNANEYEKAKDFEEDVRQIFKNCFKFNVKGDHVFNCGEQFEKLFNEKWATKEDWLDDHEPASGPVSPASESEEQEEEEEESGDSEAERNEKLQQLQKQIEMMSKQMGELANAKKKKKPTPPVQGKKPKKSGGKKDSKSGATFPALSGNKKEKSKSKSKTERERFVTYNEKQYISMGISSLPDDRMSEALRIIQSNVPSLKNTHETEIELDIDELPNGVLLKLLQFVKKHVPQAPPEPESITYVGSSAGPSGKPKKNKPMSKHEQEAQIEELKGRLGKYGGDQISPEPVQSIERADSSGDESDSEESEEE